MKINEIKKNIVLFLVYMILVFFSSFCKAQALVNKVDAKMVADSAESFDQRIYSYDMAVDPNNNVYIVYSRPTNTGADQIVYLRRLNGVWSNELIVSNDGLRSSISTHVKLKSDGSVFICYLRKATEHLYVRHVAKNGSLGTERLVSEGAWHTVMQLDSAERPMFLRENETYPGLVSKLALVSSTDGLTWSKSYLNLPQVTRFRLAEFIYAAPNFYLTYGDSCCKRNVLNGKGSTQYITGTFHNFYYATSNNGLTWDSRQIDGTQTLYENEFWTSLSIAGTNPIIGLYKYNEYNTQYNTGTSARIISPNGSSSYTDTGYLDSREGASLSVVTDLNNNLIGVWDYSPDDTHNAYFRGARGNIALARQDGRGKWVQRLQLDPFSAEGNIVLQKSNNHLHVLVLGDYVDAKLYYRELDFVYLYSEFNRLYASFPWSTFLPAILK